MNTDALISALEQQLALYRQLAKLAELQHQHVQQGQGKQLLEVLNLRQQLLDEIATVDRSVGGIGRSFAENAPAFDEQRRRRVEELVAQTQQLLEQITNADRDDALALQQQKLNLSQQIRQAHSARQVNRNYASAAYGQRPAQVDVRE